MAEVRLSIEQVDAYVRALREVAAALCTVRLPTEVVDRMLTSCMTW